MKTIAIQFAARSLTTLSLIAALLPSASAGTVIGSDGTDITPHQILQGETAIGSSTLAEAGDVFVLAWTGTDSEHHLNVMTSYDGRHFGNKVTLEDTSPFAPAIAAGKGRFYLAWTGTDSEHHLNVMSSTDGVHWGHKVMLEDTSSAGPTLRFLHGRIYLQWRGTDSNHSLNVMDSSDGITFGNKITKY